MQTKEEKQTYYGILMNRKMISEMIYLYQPVSLIEGTMEYDTILDSKCFVDVNGRGYLTTHDASTLTIDDEFSVTYVITEEALLDKYPDLSIMEAKQQFFYDTCNMAHIGFYLTSSDVIALVPFDLRSLGDKLNEIGLNLEDGNFSIPIGVIRDQNSMLDQTLETHNGDDMVVMSKDRFDEVLKCKTFEEMKAALEKINSEMIELNNDLQTIAANDSFERLVFKEGNITGNHIKQLFEAGFDVMLQTTEMDELYMFIYKFRNVCTKMVLELDEIDEAGNRIESESQAFLRVFIDMLDDLSKVRDIEIVYNQVEQMKRYAKPGIEKLATAYEEFSKKQITFDDNQSEFKMNKMIDVKAMKKFFDEKIIGQEEAKKDVIQAIVMNGLSENPSDRNSILLVGPTGSGKTLIVETVSQYLNMPMEVIDTTQLTVPGFKGADIEDFLARLITKANGDLGKAEKGIVVLDEIDKKGSEKNDDVSGRGVLNTLLPFLQGTTYDVKYNNRIVHFNTSKLTIFATGAFTDVAKVKLKDNSNTIGFGSVLKDNDTKEDIKYEKIEVEDFVKYGNMPIEFIGRFSTITQLSGHTKESLITILTDSNISALLAEQSKLRKINIDLSWTDGYLDAVASRALKLKTGARSLKATIEESIKGGRWEVLENLSDYCSIILNEKTVSDNQDCELMDQDGVSHNLKDILAKKEAEKQKVKKLF